MGFRFAWLCELLEELDKNRYQQRATHSKQENPNNRIISCWFDKHTDKIPRNGPPAIAFLSCIFPERRPDRTYNLQQKRLTQIFGRILGLGTSRLKVLESWQQKGGRDFPTCLERLMAETEFPDPEPDQQITLEEIDLALTRIAANNIASAPAIRARANGQTPIDILAPIIRRLQSHQAKWLVRMILKSYSPIEIPEYATLHGFHFLLPKLLAMQNSFEAVVDMISCDELIRLPARPSREYEAALLPLLEKEVIKPQLGVMIRRQPFDKARSIKHCVNMAGSRKMSVERKYDGEYCQIHINNSKGQGIIQIFSKSGKDSTQDRIGLHSAIKRGLKLKSPECKIKRRAILEGELLIYSREEKDILPFHHIRKHVRHGGRRIGTEQDSPKKQGEHLMIAFFDILMLDDKIMLNEPHKKRRADLKGMITPIEGEVLVAERAIIDFGHSSARDLLTRTFSHAIRMRWEGFVLKGLEDPYYSWKRGVRGIKLKKDYIAGLGDSADLCIIGGHRDPKIETELDIGRLSWTTFYVACLTNKSEVQRFGARPVFRIIDRLGSGSMSKDDVLSLNAEGRLVEQEFRLDSEFMLIRHTRKDIPPPTSMYTKPMVVEIFGAGFERPQSSDFFILRFPRRVGSKIKLHKDREIADTVDFDELQEMAQASLKEQDNAASQEELEWMERLLAADPKPKYIIDKSQSTSPSKTQHSATTSSLTPVGAIWANSLQSSAGAKWATQPSPVRIDTSELTPTEHNERYPDSAPQTPSRRSDSTTSPTSTRMREVSKRDFANVDTSPTRTLQKKKRVAFEPINRGLNLRTMSDMTDMVTEEERRRVFAGQPGKVTRDEESTEDESGEEEVAMTRHETENEREKAVMKTTSMAPPELKKDNVEPEKQNAVASEVKKGTTKVVEKLITPRPKENNLKITEKRPVIPKLRKHSTISTTTPDSSIPNTPESVAPPLPIPTTTTAPGKPLPKSTSLQPPRRKPAALIVPHITITGPIFLTSSLNNPPSQSNATNTNSTTPIQSISTLLTSQSHTHTTSSILFASILFPVPPMPTTTTLTRALILVNNEGPNTRHAIHEIRAMINTVPLPAPPYRPTPGKPLTRDVLIFDRRVLETEWWKVVSRRGGGEGENGAGEVEVEWDGKTDLGWRKHYCGTLEISIERVGGGDGVHGPYAASAEFFGE